MKRALIILLILAGGPATHGQIIDRIAAVVNRHIITLSDLRHEREIRALLGSRESSDDKTILRELIDAYIIEEQIAQFPGIEVTDAQVEPEMKRIPDLRGLPPELVRNAILRRLRTAEFFEVRFRQFLRATDDEILKYYETVFVPEAVKRGVAPIPPLVQVSETIRKNVIEEKMIHDIENWLDAIRRRSDIEVFQ